VDGVIGERDGSALIAALSGTPPIIVLAGPQLSEQRWARRSKIIDPMQKPFSHRELIARIRSLVASA
jgi:DNA-binding response OmpR family regulator